MLFVFYIVNKVKIQKKHYDNTKNEIIFHSQFSNNKAFNENFTFLLTFIKCFVYLLVSGNAVRPLEIRIKT
ncbi:hypothetical protein CMU87_08865 [Elizabethkingia anophelis]|nr:hypothetical protein [Elizabethkingia anophelis]